MGVEKDNIKDLFSAKLGDHFEPEVPASIWAGIDMLLPQHSAPVPDATSSTSSSSSTGTASSASSTTASSVSAVKVIAIVTGVAASVATGVVIVHNLDSTPPEVATISVPAVTPTDTLSIEEYKEDSVYQFIPVPPKSAVIAEAIVEPIEVLEAPVIEDKGEDLVEEKEEKKVEKINKSLGDLGIVEVEEDLSIKKVTRGLSLGLIAKADILSEDVNQTPATLAMSPQSYARYWDEIEKDNGKYELEHSQPLSFGLTIGKRITPRVSIETGLIYTYLSSKGKSSGNYLMDEKQTFHYLGVPLSINYTFYQLKKTKFYASLGGMVQKDIQGRYTGQINVLYSQTDQSEGSNSQSNVTKLASSKSKISQDNPQFSTRFMVGASWPIYNKLSLYGTIGGAYYFDAGNEYQTIYSDQKTQLDLNIGLKIDF